MKNKIEKRFLATIRVLRDNKRDIIESFESFDEDGALKQAYEFLEEVHMEYGTDSMLVQIEEHRLVRVIRGEL